MHPIDLRNETWHTLRGRVNGERAAVLGAMRRHAGLSRTVRDWAELLEMDHLSVAPRITDLVQLGFVVLDGRHGKRGLYRALFDREARAAFEQAAARARDPQLSLL